MAALRLLRGVVMLLALSETNVAERLILDDISGTNTSAHMGPEVFAPMAENILKCVNPDSTPEDPLSELQQIFGAMRAGHVKRRAVTGGWGSRPFASMSVSKVFPLHMVLALVFHESRDALLSNDSFCFEFDYSDPAAPDPTGCRPFAKSFSPLKDLRNCIIGYLNEDNIWPNRRGQAWEDVKAKGGADLRGFENVGYDVWCKKSVYDVIKVAKVETPLPVNLCQTSIDSIRRAEEMMKFTLFMAGGKATQPSKVPEHVLKKIQKTTTWPGMKAGSQQSVSDETALSISKQCFGVQNDNVEQPFASLQRLSTCLPLMYDTTEIGDGFGFQDGFAKLLDDEKYLAPTNLKAHHAYDVPPLCGRMALAAIPQMQMARYHIAPSWATVSSADRDNKWPTCVQPEYTNCRKAYFCWEKSLNKLCGIDKMCCPGDEAEAANHYDKCKIAPKGRCAKMAAK